MKTYKGLITELPPNGIFVFGSNTQGRHGLGAAKVAREKFGAIYGKAKGLQGRSYAIITKDLSKKVHPSIEAIEIEVQIADLYWYAKQHSELDFYVAYSTYGKNLNGYSNEDMAKMFTYTIIPENIVFEDGFAKLIKG